MRAKTFFLLTLAAFLLSVSAAAYAFRVVIRDAVASRFKPELPVAQPYVPPASPLPEPTPEPQPEPEAQPETTPEPVSVPTPTPKLTPAPSPAPVPSKKGVNLAVPFTSQAPKADWSMPYQEACEETSLLMINAFLTNAGAFTPDTADAQILDLVEWEKAHFGYYEDTTAEEVVETARERFGYARSRAVKISSIADIKAVIDQGMPVIIPAAGRQLFNPNFSGAGPKYHMLVVKGYTKDGKIITNDPGTRRGADYVYDADVLWNAIHDWNGGDVDNGSKMMVVVEK
jgi:hypothetical protein